MMKWLFNKKQSADRYFIDRYIRMTLESYVRDVDFKELIQNVTHLKIQLSEYESYSQFLKSEMLTTQSAVKSLNNDVHQLKNDIYQLTNELSVLNSIQSEQTYESPVRHRKVKTALQTKSKNKVR